jgi:deoxyribodipyrimidine photo-lyase
LRLSDNPALTAARDFSDGPIICLYVLETNDTLRPIGGASKWWLDKSLRSLAKDIEDCGGKLLLRRGLACETLDEVIAETGATAVFWNRRYEEAGREIDGDIKSSLKGRDIHVESFNGSVLTEPWEQKTGSGGYYKVFTPYWKSVQRDYTPPEPCRAPRKLDTVTDIKSDNLDDWGLHPQNPDWSDGFDEWRPGEDGARARLKTFLDGPISNYSDDRNRPDVGKGTSRLSPHLAFGEISPADIWRTVKDRIHNGEANEDNAMVFLSEICWRDFAYVLLFHNPKLASENYNQDFNHMPWRYSEADLKAWQRGQTGYPIVDAGMRQLYETGWMHNRVRMIVASFLTKHLLLHWHHGEEWFWDCLLDSDPASNGASWQWTAGSGADAAPYFRVFNPITQGEKFDKTGDYVRQWCPELADMPRKYLYQPWEADASTLHKAKVKLGETYPHPLVSHKDGRERALDAYNTLKEKRDAA